MGRFSRQLGPKADIILTECEFMTLDQKQLVKARRTMWDTGSTVTILSPRLIAQLNPEAFRQGGISGIGGQTEGNTYLLHVLLPTGDAITFQEVYEADIEYDAIIGMDIITKGSLHLDNSDGEIIFTFSL